MKDKCVGAGCSNLLEMSADRFDKYGNFCKNCNNRAAKEVLRKDKERIVFHRILRGEAYPEDELIYYIQHGN